jgi:hypothetical protein
MFQIKVAENNQTRFRTNTRFKSFGFLICRTKESESTKIVPLHIFPNLYPFICMFSHVQEPKVYNIQNYNFTFCFYKCESCSLVLRENYNLRVFRVLRSIWYRVWCFYSTLHLILLWRLHQRACNGLDMQHEWRKLEIHNNMNCCNQLRAINDTRTHSCVDGYYFLLTTNILVTKLEM